MKKSNKNDKRIKKKGGLMQKKINNTKKVFTENNIKKRRCFYVSIFF